VRRALAAAVLGISLWIGSLAWSGFVLLRTVLDPDRSREVAQTLYDDDAVRAQLARNIAGAVDAALPSGTPVSRDAIEVTAADALSSPAVEAVFVDALARTHGAFLGEGDAPASVDGTTFGSAARDAIVAREPALDAVLPAAPDLAVPLPTEQVPDLGPVRDALAAAVPLLALASVAGVSLALLVTSHRPSVLRRAGRWALALSATVLLAAYAVPYLAEALLPGQAAVVAALVRAMAEAMRIPALLFAGTGLAAIAASVAWRRAPGPRPVEPSRHRVPARGARPVRRDLPRPARGPAVAPVPRTRLPGGDVPGGRRPGPGPRPHVPIAAPRPAAPSPTRVGPAPTVVQAAAAPGRPAAPADATAVDGAAPPGARWVEGVGWVLESGAIPPEARWVAGVGYVLDDR